MSRLSENSPWDGLKSLLGPGRVILEGEEIEFHSYDVWSVAAKWRQQGKQPYRPEAVVRPLNSDQVRRVLRWAQGEGVAVTPWGMGSSVTGAPIPLRGGISLDMSAMNRILALDETNLIVKVQAGIRGSELEAELNERGYTLNHSPQSLHRSTVGGWISTRATGQFSSKWGGIEDLAVAFTVVLPSGQEIEVGGWPRAAVGPDLRHIFLGAEGTMGVITEAALKIFPLPEHCILETVIFESVEAGLNSMRRIMRAGLRPFLMRFYDHRETAYVTGDDGHHGCVMFVGFEGFRAVSEAEYRAALQICAEEGGAASGPEAAQHWMDHRFDFSTVEAVLAQPGGFAETIEVAQYWDAVLETYYALREALVPHSSEVLGHFSHVYPQGTSLYMILLGQAADDLEAEQHILRIWDLAMRICLEKEAAISHHHGVGIARLPYLRAGLGAGFQVLERLKACLDPMNIMNPGKLSLDP